MKRIENILVYVDNLDALEAVLDQIIRVTEASQARVTFAGVVEPDLWWMMESRGPDSKTCANALASELQTRISETTISLKATGIDTEVNVFIGEPTKVLIHAVEQGKYDILMKAAEKTQGRPIGSVDNRLLRYVSCPVALLHPRSTDSTGKILAAVDFDPREADKSIINDAILGTAVRAVTSIYREFYILHAWQLFGESFLSSPRFKMSKTQLSDLLEDERKLHSDKLETYVEDFFEKLGSEVTEFVIPHTLLVKGEPRKVIPEQAEMLKPDLIVLGNMSRRGVAGLFIGNTAESIVNEVNCSILVVKPAGFAAPEVD